MEIEIDNTAITETEAQYMMDKRLLQTQKMSGVKRIRVGRKRRTLRQDIEPGKASL